VIRIDTRVGVVLGLRHEVGGHPFGIGVARDDDDLGRAGVEVDRAIAAVAGDNRFGRRDVAIAGADDLVDARDRPRAVGQRRNRVRAAHPEQPGDAGLERGRQDGVLRPRTRDHDLAHARDARRNRGHQQRRGKRKAAAGDVAADAGERFDALLDDHARRDLHVEVFGDLTIRDTGDVARGLADGAADVGADSRRAGLHLRVRDFDVTSQPVVPAAQPRQRDVAPVPDLPHDPPHPALERRIRRRRAPRQPGDRSFVRLQDAHAHNTILFSGYSTMPWARAVFNLGIRSRTVRSSMMVLTATQS
jgi:hypothetical protein